jgi:hypothetical protein
LLLWLLQQDAITRALLRQHHTADLLCVMLSLQASMSCAVVKQHHLTLQLQMLGKLILLLLLLCWRLLLLVLWRSQHHVLSSRRLRLLNSAMFAQHLLCCACMDSSTAEQYSR